jgi:hypothetical protein
MWKEKAGRSELGMTIKFKGKFKKTSKATSKAKPREIPIFSCLRTALRAPPIVLDAVAGLHKSFPACSYNSRQGFLQ